LVTTTLGGFPVLTPIFVPATVVAGGGSRLQRPRSGRGQFDFFAGADLVLLGARRSPGAGVAGWCWG
jgi:hypothetical protein